MRPEYYVVDPETGCWEYVGSRDPEGYGFHWTGKTQCAHRVSWEDVRGPIPPGLLVLHRCDNPPCVNPDHLYLGTQSDNLREAFAKGRVATTFPAGEAHPSAKLTKAAVADIRAGRSEGRTLRALADEFGVACSTVRNIVIGKTWRGL